MRIIKGWKRTLGQSLGNNRSVVDIETEDGQDWYELMYRLDDRPEKWVVCVNTNGYVNWATDGHVSERFAPSDGGVLVLLDDFDTSTERSVIFNGTEFVPIPVEQPVVRTKEDIMADLIKLQEELKAL